MSENDNPLGSVDEINGESDQMQNGKPKKRGINSLEIKIIKKKKYF